MIPLYRARDMESAANLLLRNFRHVLIRSQFDNPIRIRFRADGIRGHPVYFNKVPSQLVRWQKNGGALINYSSRNPPGSYEAILFVECPKLMYGLRWHTRDASVIGVIYQPPSWRPFEERIAWRYEGARLANRMRHMAIVRDYVEKLPWLTSRTLASLLRARESSQSSSAPE